MKLTRQVDTIVIHCSASPNGRPVKPEEVDRWHVAPPHEFKRSDYWRQRFNPQFLAIGYHYLIDINGKRYTGRHLNEVPAQARGHNARAVAICLAGTDRFTPEQWSELDALIHQLRADTANGGNPVNNIRIIGHYQYPDAHKTCPNFDVPAWLANKMIPQAKNVYLAD